MTSSLRPPRPTQRSLKAVSAALLETLHPLQKAPSSPRLREAHARLSHMPLHGPCWCLSHAPHGSCRCQSQRLLQEQPGAPPKMATTPKHALLRRPCPIGHHAQAQYSSTAKGRPTTPPSRPCEGPYAQARQAIMTPNTKRTTAAPPNDGRHAQASGARVRVQSHGQAAPAIQRPTADGLSEAIRLNQVAL